MQIYKYTNIQTYKYTNIQIYKIQIYKYICMYGYHCHLRSWDGTLYRKFR